ncbi:MAG: hypothetical protein GX997_08560 [Bacteroidales bacterium]|nr:hypothetical protein [Bacteroidales bacterium]
MESIPGNRVAAPDTLLRELKESATENTIVTSSCGKEYRFNINEKMNDLNVCRNIPAFFKIIDLQILGLF